MFASSQQAADTAAVTSTQPAVVELSISSHPAILLFLCFIAFYGLAVVPCGQWEAALPAEGKAAPSLNKD